MAAAEHEIDQLLPQSRDLTREFVRSVYERFDKTLRGFLMNNLRNQAEADDMAQEVYLRFSRLQNHRQIRSEKAFLFTTAVNLLRDRSRRLATQLEKASIPMDDVSLECTVYDPAHRMVHGERLQLARRALDRCSPNCRQAFELSRIDGRSYAEIAALMGVSVSMVEKHVSAALREIREALQD